MEQNKSFFTFMAVLLLPFITQSIHAQSSVNTLCDTLFLRNRPFIAARIKTKEKKAMDRAVGSHYLMGANNRTLRQGEGYYQNGVLLFNQVRYGFTDYFSLNAGFFPLLLLEERPVLFWVSPKFSFPIIKDRLYAGGGGLLSRITGGGGENFGFYNANLTIGSVRNNATAGIGRLYIDEEWEKKPAFSLGFTLTPFKRISIVSESYTRKNSDTWGLITISGLRFYVRKATIDLAFLVIAEDEDLTTLPWLSATFPFGGNK